MNIEKIETYKKVLTLLESKDIHVSDSDFDRPWGGFFVIDPIDTNKFIDQFYPELATELTATTLPLSPKILCVAPSQRLSWQYHQRRSELWKLIEGNAAYKRSDTDEEGNVSIMELNKTITLLQGERHRLIGLKEWGIIAEIWQHTDVDNPSNEEDIIRLQDDFGR